MNEIATPPARLRYSIAESAQLLSISQRQIWRLIADGRLPAVREGRRVFVAREQLERAAASALPGAS